jgi:hypothetical protein
MIKHFINGDRYRITIIRLFQKHTKIDVYVFITITGSIPLLVDYQTCLLLRFRRIYYAFVPVHSQDLDFHTKLFCLSTARTWISILHFCACPQPGPGFPCPGCGQAQKCSVEIQVLAVDRHTNVVWKSRSWLWTGTNM